MNTHNHNGRITLHAQTSNAPGLSTIELTPGAIDAPLARLSITAAITATELRAYDLAIEARRTFDATHRERCRLAAIDAEREAEALRVLREMMKLSTRRAARAIGGAA